MIFVVVKFCVFFEVRTEFLFINLYILIYTNAY
jgi:hypothetical protein